MRKGFGTALEWLGAAGMVGLAILGAKLLVDRLMCTGMEGHPTGLSASVWWVSVMADGGLWGGWPWASPCAGLRCGRSSDASSR